MRAKQAFWTGIIMRAKQAFWTGIVRLFVSQCWSRAGRRPETENRTRRPLSQNVVVWLLCRTALRQQGLDICGFFSFFFLALPASILSRGHTGRCYQPTGGSRAKNSSVQKRLAKSALAGCRWAVQAGLLTPLTFARHRLSPLAAFTSGAYFLHNGRR